MRCYFNLADGDEVFRDVEGTEVSDADQARSEALQAIWEISQEMDDEEFDWSRWALDVTDSSGEVLLSVLIGDVIAEKSTSLH